MVYAALLNLTARAEWYALQLPRQVNLPVHQLLRLFQQYPVRLVVPEKKNRHDQQASSQSELFFCSPLLSILPLHYSSLQFDLLSSQFFFFSFSSDQTK